jgi:Protein of unknown function (DUF3489)
MIHADKSTASAPETAGTNPSRTEAKTPPRPKRKPVKAEPVKKLPATAKTPARGTKKAKLLSLLRRPSGASLDQLTKASGWQAHSVRGFLSGELKKKMGLRVQSAKHSDGVRTYRLTSK